MFEKDIKARLGETKFMKFRIPIYFTSHSKPERWGRYLSLNKKKENK